MFANEEREGAQPPAYDDSALVALIAELARENRRLLGEREYWRGVAAGTGSRDLGRKMFDEAVDRGLSKAGQSKELDEPGSG